MVSFNVCFFTAESNFREKWGLFFAFSIPNDGKIVKLRADKLMMAAEKINEGPVSGVTGRKKHSQIIQLHQEILFWKHLQIHG